MKDTKLLSELRRSWDFTRNMTMEFIHSVPEDKWEFSPHPKYSPLAKQFRHMIWVTGLYADGFVNRKIDDCESKKTHYSGEIDKENLLRGFAEIDKKLSQILQDLEGENLDEFEIDFFGEKMGFSEYTHILIEHESIHHGLWSMYASFGEFETPKSWQQNWEL